MPALDVTEEQIISLLSQLRPEQQARVLNRFAIASNGNGANGTASATPMTERPRPVRGKAKGYILYVADDFDAPLDDMKEYME